MILDLTSQEEVFFVVRLPGGINMSIGCKDGAAAFVILNNPDEIHVTSLSEMKHSWLPLLFNDGIVKHGLTAQLK